MCKLKFKRIVAHNVKKTFGVLIRRISYLTGVDIVIGRHKRCACDRVLYNNKKKLFENKIELVCAVTYGVPKIKYVRSTGLYVNQTIIISLSPVQI